MSSPESARWNRAKEILLQLRSIPPDLRVARAVRVCRGDEELEAEVMSLLAAAPGADRYFDELGQALDHGVHRDGGPQRWIGETVADLCLVELIGEGGMGMVFRAERTGSPESPQVAVKLLRIPSELSRRRFDIERDGLGRLEHSGITRFLGSGSAKDGTPFIVTELVDGEPIDAFAQRRRLDIDGRVRLMLEVCDAVAHAHSRRVLHRDLKPRNILVRATGMPTVLDFGIAKLLDTVDLGEPTTLTRMANALTLDYASPEQIHTRPVSERSDVYSLGAILYDLLAGAPPPTPLEARPVPPHRVFQSLGGSREEVAADRRTTAPALTQRLQGRLGEVLRRTCHADPERRYQSVQGLVSDLARHCIRSNPPGRSD